MTHLLKTAQPKCATAQHPGAVHTTVAPGQPQKSQREVRALRSTSCTLQSMPILPIFFCKVVS
jgi:hypothetical protein